jgi:hypothetical protein
VRLSEKLGAGWTNATSPMETPFHHDAQDPSPRVRLQLACTIGAAKNDEAIRSSPNSHAGDSERSVDKRRPPQVRRQDRTALLFARSPRIRSFSKACPGPFLAELALSIACATQRGRSGSGPHFLCTVSTQLSVLAALGEGLERSGQALVTPARERALRPLFSEARTVSPHGKRARGSRRGDPRARF